MIVKRCPACNCPIDPDDHGNRGYCNDICYNYQKRLRSKKNYKSQKEVLKEFEKADLLLKNYFKLCNSEKYIHVLHLDQSGLDWDIAKKVITVKGQTAIVIGNYAYTIYINQLVRIWKL